MKRRLRIAVSVFFGIVTVGLCVLWVRSYSTIHWVKIVPATKRQTSVHVIPGQLAVQAGGEPNVYALCGWTAGSRPAAEVSSHWIGGTLGFCLEAYPGGHLVVAPFWCLAAVAAALAALPWVPFSNRFSLRTMLIATTLAAVVLGAVCYAVR